MASSSSPPRRFNIDSSNQPILQFIATTIPFAILCLWFLYSTARRPYIDCYQPVDGVTDDTTANNYSAQCSQYVPLKQFALVFLFLAFLWGLLVAYLLFYVPRRHQLVREYLLHGTTTVIGDVYFNREGQEKTCGGLLGRLSSSQQPAYGHAVYPHPSSSGTDKAGGAGPIMLRRQVRVFERYTRERAAIICLPNLPYSGQPKIDLEIDRDVTDLNRRRLLLLSRYAIGWLVFCFIAPIFIVETIRQLDQKNNNNNGATTDGGDGGDGDNDVDNNDDPPPWQPDIDLHNFPSYYYLTSFVVLPVTVLLWTMVLWWWHRRWMTYQHSVVSSDDDAGGGGYYEQQRDPKTTTGCCFDDEDCESIEIKDYQPPKTNMVERDSKRGEKGATV